VIYYPLCACRIKYVIDDRTSDEEKGGEPGLTRVYLQDGESQESLLRRFRKRVTRDGILSTVKRKRFFVSKSEQRRLAHRKAIRRERRRQWRERRRQGGGR
jgi:small subunit ribosomal protein S21